MKIQTETLAVKTHGAACWDALVASCNKSANWADDSDDEEDATSPVPDASIISTDSSTDSTPVSSERDFLESPYVSYDWSDDDDITGSPSSSEVPTLDSDSDSIFSVDSKFVGKYMTTILEEEEEEDDEVPEMDMGMELSDPLFCERRSPTEAEDLALLEYEGDIVVNYPSQDIRAPRNQVLKSPASAQIENHDVADHTVFGRSGRRVGNCKTLNSPSIAEIENLHDVVNHRMLKRLGLLAGYLRREIIAFRPPPVQETNLDVLARVSASRSPSRPTFPNTNLDILANVAFDSTHLHSLPSLRLVRC